MKKKKQKNKKIISLQDRVPKFQKQRKKKASRRLILYLSLFFILISLIVYIQSPLSHVKEIDLVGNELLDREEVIELSELNLKQNFWSVSSPKIKKQLKKSPYIKDAEVKRVFPNRVELIINEERLIGYTKQKNKYHRILANGFIVPESNKVMSGDAPLLHNFEDKEYLERMTEELSKLNPAILKLISEIYWEPLENNKNKIQLYMKDGLIVKGTIRDFHERMDVYPSIASQLDASEKGIIYIGLGAYFESF